MSAYIVPVQYAVNLIDVMKRYDVTVEQLLHNTGIEKQFLDDLDGFLSQEQHLALITNARKLSQDPAVGLYLGMSRNIPSLDRFGYAMLCAETFRDSMQMGLKFQHITGRFTGRQLRLSLTEEGGVATLQVDDDPSLGELRQFVIEETLGATVELSRKMLGEELPLIMISVSYPEPSYGDAYRRLLRCPVEFDASHTRVRFNADILDRELPFARGSSSKMYERYCEQQADILASREDSVAAEVRAILLQNAMNMPSVDDVADQLHCSARTLRRRLKESGHSYKLIVDDVKESIAKQLLQSSKRSVEEIALDLGFCDPNSFYRAFKKWTGYTPNGYRRHADTSH